MQLHSKSAFDEYHFSLVELAARHEIGLVRELGLRAEGDPGEAAAAMAGRFPQQQHARVVAARLDVRLHVLAPQARHVVSRRPVALVGIAPRIEDMGTSGRSLLENGDEIAQGSGGHGRGERGGHE